jgi:hypothetical protein
MENLLQFNLIEDIEEAPRDTLFYDNQINDYMINHEGEQKAKDIKLLREMGYDKKMINKIYALLRPENIERAIEYMTEIGGIYQHNFFRNHIPNRDKNLCFICKKPRRFHLDYIPDDLLGEMDLNNDFNNNLDNNMNNSINNDFNLIVKQKETFLCTVCFEEIDEEEKNYNALRCGHICCTQCWINYLKSLINDAKVEKIKCIDHKCNEILPEEFIMKHIETDQKLIDKYNKFKARAEIFNNPNKKQCPEVNCESYLTKSKEKYVKCQLGHEYCFECLRKPHGKSSCEDILEKEFQSWKQGKVLKKCPKCKIYTEKNEGCNHMTCTSCKFQWCWLCEGEYKYGHFQQGACNGHQFTKVNFLSEIKPKATNINNRPYNYNNNTYNNIRNYNNYRYNNNQNLLNPYNNNLRIRRRTYFPYDDEQTNCCCSLSNIFRCCLHKVNYTHNDIDGYERLNALMIWFFGYFLLCAYQIYNNSKDNQIKMADENANCHYKFYGYLIAFFLFICYQIAFTCLITPFILISLIYPFFVYKIKMFFSIGDAFYAFNHR